MFQVTKGFSKTTCLIIHLETLSYLFLTITQTTSKNFKRLKSNSHHLNYFFADNFVREKI